MVGELELNFESLELSAGSGLTLHAYTAEPGSASQQALDLLATWAATLADEQTRGTPEPARRA